MQRGEVWWADFDERRPVVLLSDDESSGFQAVQVVAPAGVDIGGLGVEVAIGALEGLPFEGVLRFAVPRPGFTPCTWLTTVSREDLVERAGALSSAKLREVAEALRAAGLGDTFSDSPRPCARDMARHPAQVPGRIRRVS
ncbi:type II toxin-antitoxin system PemK/MazF family toxin [Streptomyces broussonetiae]|uniref:Type II toxin-antitoxin system PemK/MazF family toxin n=1 Tax=Streptomyces broussonetiae TaxID=2686304 RepID=A0ABV5EAQ3_9ACTN